MRGARSSCWWREPSAGHEPVEGKNDLDRTFTNWNKAGKIAEPGKEKRWLEEPTKRKAKPGCLWFCSSAHREINITGACQNAAFREAGSSTVTWQTYSPGGSFDRDRLNLKGSILDSGPRPSMN
jgi:hypothetical protein